MENNYLRAAGHWNIYPCQKYTYYTFSKYLRSVHISTEDFKHEFLIRLTQKPRRGIRIIQVV